MAAPSIDPQSPQFKSSLKLARNEPINFALCIEKTGKQPALIFHNVKLGKALFNGVKKDDPTYTKAAFGTAQLDGKILTLNIEKATGGVPKACKLWVRNTKHPIIKKILPLVDGKVLADGDDEQADDTPVTPQNPPVVNDLKQQLRKKLEAGKGKLPAKTMALVAKKAMASFQANDEAAVQKLLASLDAALVKTAQQPKTDTPTPKQATEQTPKTSDGAKLITLAKKWAALRAQQLKSAKMIAKLLLAEDPNLTQEAKAILTLFSVFNQKLGPCLNRIAANPNAADRPKFVAHCETVTAQYLKLLQVDGHFNHMKSNPYIHMDLKADLSPTLKAIQKELKAWV